MNTRIARSPLFSLLDDEDAVEAIARQAGSAAVLSGDGELNGHMRRIAALVEAPDRALATYEVLGLLLGLQRRDLSCARPRFILTRTQMRIVAAVHDELEGSLDCAHDARVLASAFGVSATTLKPVLLAGIREHRRGGTSASGAWRSPPPCLPGERASPKPPCASATRTRASSPPRSRGNTEPHRANGGGVDSARGRAFTKSRGSSRNADARRLAGGMVTEPNHF